MKEFDRHITRVISNKLADTVQGSSKDLISNKHLFYIGSNAKVSENLNEAFGEVNELSSIANACVILGNRDFRQIDAIIVEINNSDSFLPEFTHLGRISRALKIPLIAIGEVSDKDFQKEILKNGADDIFTENIDAEKLNDWIDFLKVLKVGKTDETQKTRNLATVKIPFAKRAFDILVSGSALLILSPLMLVIAIIIKLESKGDVFYNAKRAGTGYKIFDFYKFRSMRQGADAEVKKMQHMNEYSANSESEAKSVFFKVKDDPRITKFGHFLRNTSLDELPQLINVLKGDMSLVGNRPLPLYEAQQLTKDEWAMRFMAPAGITGLWQVTKRGKGDLSEEERIQLDIDYAKNSSFWYDIGLIFKTFPALLQEEKV